MLIGLIHQALVGNQELKILNEDIQIASNEVLARSGAYLPFVTAGGGAGLNKFSRFTAEGAGIRDDPYLPGQFFPNPLRKFPGGRQPLLADRHLEAVAECQGRGSAALPRRQ